MGVQVLGFKLNRCETCGAFILFSGCLVIYVCGHFGLYLFPLSLEVVN